MTSKPSMQNGLHPINPFKDIYIYMYISPRRISLSALGGCPLSLPKIISLRNIKGSVGWFTKKQGNVHNSQMDMRFISSIVMAPKEAHDSLLEWDNSWVHIGVSPFSVIVTTSIITCFVGETFSLKKR